MSESSITSSSNVQSNPATSASAHSASAASSPKNTTLASDLTSTAPIKSLQNLQQLNPTAYNQWLALVAQTLITDGQRYESRVEAAMKRLRDGDEP